MSRRQRVKCARAGAAVGWGWLAPGWTITLLTAGQPLRCLCMAHSDFSRGAFCSEPAL